MATDSALKRATAEAKAAAKPKDKGGFKWIPALITVLVGVVLWFCPMPANLVDFVPTDGAYAKIDPMITAVNCWHLFAIFVATIVGLILKPLPMGAVSIIGITVIMLTKILSTGASSTAYITNALSGFHNTTIWLIVIAFFISRGFIKTGLGNRVAYLFMSKFGKKTLGLSYSLAVTDLILSPAMPSNTARAGGVVYPIVSSLSRVFGSRPDDGTERKIGSYLHVTAFQADMITSGMFMTSMAANPLAVTLAASTAGINIDWVGWAVAAFVPSLICLIVIPFVIYKIFPPEVKQTPEAAQMAKSKLDEMGSVKTSEKLMIGVFLLILILWIAGSSIGLNATVTAFIGLSVLLIVGVLDWNDIKNEKGAWDTLVWFAALVMMATYLNSMGLIPWFSNLMTGVVAGMPWLIAIILLAVVYFLSHYAFASATAHVSAMYAAFLSVAVAAGAPAMLSAMILGIFGNTMGCLTHYGSGPAPVFFGSGYVSQGKWWTIGIVCAVVSMLIFFTIGFGWWKVIGLW
ncbi:anion permease [Curtanaerobium respiraculi]|uniref:anion permease n=1 Tax=Curtanaerobium respiraculi TaxID=2949669 RepID=UPI0024B36CD5|nr:anion permease [Curtanaerobium respiraculi]